MRLMVDWDSTLVEAQGEQRWELEPHWTSRGACGHRALNVYDVCADGGAVLENETMSVESVSNSSSAYAYASKMNSKQISSAYARDLQCSSPLASSRRENFESQGGTSCRISKFF